MVSIPSLKGLLQITGDGTEHGKSYLNHSTLNYCKIYMEKYSIRSIRSCLVTHVSSLHLYTVTRIFAASISGMVQPFTHHIELTRPMIGLDYCFHQEMVEVIMIECEPLISNYISLCQIKIIE
jgi:hypothetical protein